MQDFSKYSISQLQALEVQLIEELKKRHFLSVSQAREQILHIARNAGISAAQLVAIKSPKAPKASPSVMKYQNPNDAAQQWSGRGRQPAWVKEWIETGKSLDEVQI
ncbi:H-NS histone family protein [Massilia pseudoviolaceinigra]|uniref:H-NS histone family protein n=1 Tax=Massilia pseudoviolaceinigra TaxID=3057165 RepID=UPI00279668EA|nr:H-NS histone family protein [Massilia sp. CCM 9206]MDQ1924611.1 H-NS histone family protein [Massilia sp. CCM 9206]